MTDRAAYLRNYMANRRLVRIAAATEFLGGACVDCGEVERLEFDHVDPLSKEFPIASAGTISEDRFWSEVRKCVLRCRPCHQQKTNRDFGHKPARGRHGTISTYRYCHCEKCRAAVRKYRASIS
jgi:5-methylcytosine-specific restriction endonuclease McrA